VSPSVSTIPKVLQQYEGEILEDWMRQQLAAPTARPDLMSDTELRSQSREFLGHLRQGASTGDLARIDGASWAPAREMLARVSASRAAQGFSPSETATFVFSLKQPLFGRLRQELAHDADRLADELWRATVLLDKLGLHTMEVVIRGRELLLARQQEDMLELSTPVVKLWDGVLALPMIGTLDSARTQVVMESLLQRIVETGAEVAIIDITGVPTVDTLVAQHLLKTVTAARLMGADCIISGIRPQIAATIVHLGVNLTDVVTKATLADAFALALKRSGITLARAGPARNAGG
jgi:rsbT co-antagonist protein RsbR